MTHEAQQRAKTFFEPNHGHGSGQCSASQRAVYVHACWRRGAHSRAQNNTRLAQLTSGTQNTARTFQFSISATGFVSRLLFVSAMVESTVDQKKLFLKNKNISNVHAKTLFEIAMALLTIRVSFTSKSRFSATFSILLRFGESWNPTNCEKFNAEDFLQVMSSKPSILVKWTKLISEIFL